MKQVICIKICRDLYSKTSISGRMHAFNMYGSWDLNRSLTCRQSEKLYQLKNWRQRNNFQQNHFVRRFGFCFHLPYLHFQLFTHNVLRKMVCNFFVIFRKIFWRYVSLLDRRTDKYELNFPNVRDSMLSHSTQIHHAGPAWNFTLAYELSSHLLEKCQR